MKTLDLILLAGTAYLFLRGRNGAPVTLPTPGELAAPAEGGQVAAPAVVAPSIPPEVNLILQPEGLGLSWTPGFAANTDPFTNASQVGGMPGHFDASPNMWYMNPSMYWVDELGNRRQR